MTAATATPAGDDRSDADLLPPTSHGDADAFGVLFAPAPRPAVGGGAAHDGQPRGRRRRAPGRAGRGLPAGRLLPRRRGRHHLAAPGRGQRLPGPAAGGEGPPRRAAARRPRRARATAARWRTADRRRRRPRRPARWPTSAGGWCSARWRTLPAEQRAALVLVDMEGYPVAEAAEMLDCAAGTVKSRCSRGRARLAGCSASLAPGTVTRTTPSPGTPPVAARPIQDARAGPPPRPESDRPRPTAPERRCTTMTDEPETRARPRQEEQVAACSPTPGTTEPMPADVAARLDRVLADLAGRARRRRGRPVVRPRRPRRRRRGRRCWSPPRPWSSSASASARSSDRRRRRRRRRQRRAGGGRGDADAGDRRREADPAPAERRGRRRRTAPRRAEPRATGDACSSERLRRDVRRPGAAAAPSPTDAAAGDRGAGDARPTAGRRRLPTPAPGAGRRSCRSATTAARRCWSFRGARGRHPGRRPLPVRQRPTPSGRSTLPVP